MTKQPEYLISVIIPVFDSENYLQDCINSLVRQTMYDKTEIIFIDDGSTDKSGELLDSAAEEYENIKVYHVSNGGVSYARNIGLDKARGKYVSFIDADDYIESDYYECLLNEFSEDCDLVGCGYTAEYRDRSILHTCIKKTEFYHDDIIKAFLQEKILCPVAADKLFLREMIGNLRLDTSLDIGEDRWFLFEYLQKSKHIVVLPNGKYHYRMHDSSACRRRFNDKRLDSLTVCERITSKVKEIYPELTCVAECSEIDMKCRVYGELYRDNVIEKYKECYAGIKREIRKFSLGKKIKHSSKKHTAALLAAKISPKLYVFLKNGLKLQYR